MGLAIIRQSLLLIHSDMVEILVSTMGSEEVDGRFSLFNLPEEDRLEMQGDILSTLLTNALNGTEDDGRSEVEPCRSMPCLAGSAPPATTRDS